MSRVTYPGFRRLVTLGALSATAMAVTACAGSLDNTAKASLGDSTTITEVTTTTVFSTTTVTETVEPASEPEPAPEPEPALAENNTQLGFVAPPPAPATVPAPAPVYYANCSEARAAGAAPIYTDQPGYSRKLDRDDDGIACG
ncbi:excalibur calcium-binding domain-containing protein [Corynebacterium cystitidis]|uniref:Excalibur calcium-binding domain-containing protein n=1 Tax=Corynebacterium cystitidis DSM 20524 TaxID=1121357 RepID=A0A1H9RF44_9CORY|nr:excalibur calcium-binding domain-containing protein [Corynebacterium cystitidis]WJY81451.1 Excalibur calcium-binding domain protein [Corynebacterium cystitidis DSM 20524]SER71451.1 Excalibur calcium-binding domain-containing protein [Corynebacterium cystitidis DSM 20524]SNV87325.1 lipoprotein [Corynebacterium cystitidis]